MSEAWLPAEMWDYAADNGEPQTHVIYDPDLGTLAYIAENGSVIAVGADDASH
jgi:hypothetical protein